MIVGNIFYCSNYHFYIGRATVLYNATGVCSLPNCLKMSMISSNLLIAIRITTVALDCAASLIFSEIFPEHVVPVVTQKFSLMPFAVSGIICEAGTAIALEMPGITSALIPNSFAASILPVHGQTQADRRLLALRFFYNLRYR